jgi:hypothetical protein
MSWRARLPRSLRRAAFVDVWNVGVVEAPIASFLRADFRPEVRWLPALGPELLHADPFALRRDGREWVLCERLDHADGRGVLVARELTAAGFGEELPLLCAEHHLSYPFVVEDEGELWLIPESHEAGEVALWRCRSFPGEWERVGALLPSFRGIDSSLTRHAGRWWLFTSEHGNGHDRRLHVFHAERLTGPWRAHAHNPVKDDARSVRGAGTPFVHAGELYRPAQDCSRIHEERITLNRVAELTPARFHEETVRVLEPLGTGPYPHKLHTLSAAGERTLLDACRETFMLAHPILARFKVARVLRRF